MTAREMLRSCADSLENFQVVAGKADPRVPMLRALADRMEEALKDPHPGIMEFVPCEQCKIRYAIAALDAPLPRV